MPRSRPATAITRPAPFPRGSTFRLAAPADFHLPRDLCSYGYFLLAPNHWDVDTHVFHRVLTLSDGAADRAVHLQITQPSAGAPLRVRADRALSSAERTRVRAQLTRMLRLDESAATLAEFHALDPRFAPAGRGRLFRSPTLFEDIIKTVTSCNVTWPGTVIMNRRFCEVLGPRAATGVPGFPSAAKLARTRPQTLRARCRAGYRDTRLVELARLFHTGQINTAALEDPAAPDDAVFKLLTDLPGIGPYAAANIMQLMGRYSRLPLDTESVRHGKNILGYRGSSSAIMKRLHAHYAPMGRHAFRSYWFELWDFYESKAGPAHTWRRETTGQMFTAATLNKQS